MVVREDPDAERWGRWSWMANSESYALMGGAVSASDSLRQRMFAVCISSILICFVRFLPGANHLLSMPTYMKFKAVNGCQLSTGRLLVGCRDARPLCGRTTGG